MRSAIGLVERTVLASRLKHLVEIGMLTKRPDPGHKQKAIYSLTEASIELVPVMAALGSWGRRWLTAASAGPYGGAPCDQSPPWI